MIKKILVSQPKPASDKSPYYEIANEYGVELVFRPFFKVEGISAKEFRQQKVSILSHTAVVFTSRHAIDNYFNIAKEMRLTIPEDMKYFCVTETISLYIQKYVQYRKRKIFFGSTGKIDDLVPLMQKHKAEKYLVPLSDVHNDHVKELLDAKNLNHTECVMFRTVSNDLTEQEVKDFDYDMLLFFSPTGVKALTKNIPDFKQDPGRRVLQKRLAEEVTTMVHSAEDLQTAQEASNILFGKATKENLQKLDEATFLDVFNGVPHYTVGRDVIGQPAIDVFNQEGMDIFPSKSEMRKLVKGGGVSLNKEKLAAFDKVVTEDDLIDGKYLLVQKGKKNYFLITVK